MQSESHNWVTEFVKYWTESHEFHEIIETDMMPAYPTQEAMFAEIISDPPVATKYNGMGHVTDFKMARTHCVPYQSPQLSPPKVTAGCQQITYTEQVRSASPPSQPYVQYKQLYERSLKDPESFWGDMAENFYWQKKWAPNHISYNFDVNKGPIHVEWFKGAETNLSYNCLDRNILQGRGKQPCFIWEGNEPTDTSSMSYEDVLYEVCRVANWLKSQGVRPTDTVAIYMPMVLQLPIAMLACARIGALHTVVFGGFSAEALAGRLVDCRAKVLITATGSMRGRKPILLKEIADAAMCMAAQGGVNVESCLVLDVQHASAITRTTTYMLPGRDVWYDEVIPYHAPSCTPQWVSSEHPLFLLYTSGSTGKPKGVRHNTAGFMVHSYATCKYVFNTNPGDVMWSTGDCGWVTGHTCLAYGPLLNGATSVVFEGIPSYPDHSRVWRIVEKHRVKAIYLAPTAIRDMMAQSPEFVTRHDRSSLEILGTVGEPINPEAWKWYDEVVGEGKRPIVDTWWQTETGGVMISPMPGAWGEKPGSVSLPFFGVVPAILDPVTGKELHGEAEGVLAIKQAWPSTIRGVHGDQSRFEKTYFEPHTGYYYCGDGAKRDENGYFWITGRVDDVLNVSGHRIGTAEVESALVQFPSCAEAAVIGVPHPVKGQAVYAYVTLMQGVQLTASIKEELIRSVRTTIGPFAAPDVIHWAPAMPKTRSGKIMRRILRKIAVGEYSDLGDTSTLTDPSVVTQLVQLRPPATGTFSTTTMIHAKL